MPTSQELRIAVCDDQATDLAVTIRMTEAILGELQTPYILDRYESGERLLSDLVGGKVYHLLLLDVMMEGLDGMQLAAGLEPLERKPQVVFISSNRDMALYGYRVNATRYLAKPLDAADLREALTYCIRIWQTKKEILLPTDRGKQRTSLADIQFAEAFDRGTRLVLKDETLEVRLKFSEIETMLPGPDFLTCHRGFVVNLGCVKYVHQYEFVLKSGLTVPIGKARYSEIKQKFTGYLTD